MIDANKFKILDQTNGWNHAPRSSLRQSIIRGSHCNAKAHRCSQRSYSYKPSLRGSFWNICSHIHVHHMRARCLHCSVGESSLPAAGQNRVGQISLPHHGCCSSLQVSCINGLHHSHRAHSHLLRRPGQSSKSPRCPQKEILGENDLNETVVEETKIQTLVFRVSKRLLN